MNILPEMKPTDNKKFVDKADFLRNDSDKSQSKVTLWMKWLILPIVFIAVCVRFWGIEAGLPQVYHPDEPNYVRIAQNIFITGDLNPHIFSYPSVFFYLNALVYVPFYLVGQLAGIFHSPMDIVAPETLLQGISITPLPATLMLGRLLTLAFSVGSVLLVYLIGHQLMKSRTVGLLAALLLTVSTPSVVNSRTITPDAFLVFFVLFAFWGAVQVFEHGQTWHYIVAGIGIGLVVGTKYNGVLIATVLIAGHFFRNGLLGLRDFKLCLAGVVSIAAFFLTTPYALLDYSNFIAHIQLEAQHYSKGHLGMEGQTLNFYLNYLGTIEGPIILLALFSSAWGFIAGSKRIILLSVFPLLYFVFIIQFTVRNDRTLMPLLPFAYLLGSCLLVKLAHSQLSWLRGRWIPTARRLLISLLTFIAVVSVLFPFNTMVRASISRSNGITARHDAMQWINQNIPAGSRIAVDAYGPYVNPERFVVSGMPTMADHELDWYRENLDYLVFSKITFRRFYNARDVFPNEVRRYDYMFQVLQEVKIFPHEDYEILIYKVPKF